MKTKTVQQLVDEYREKQSRTEYAEISVMTPARTEWKYSNISNLVYDQKDPDYLYYTWIEFDSVHVTLSTEEPYNVQKKEEHIRIFGYILRFVTRNDE